MPTKIKAFVSNDLVAALWTESLAEAYLRMIQAEVRHLPVVDHNRGVVGIVSDRDFYRMMHADFSNPDVDPSTHASFDSKTRVRDIMSWPVETIDEKASLSDAARKMLDTKISALLVEREGMIIGIVTTEDLLRSMIDAEHGTLADLPGELKATLYRSPVGQIAQALANAGI